MTREQLEHILRVAGAITNQDRLVVVGSQAIIGQFPDAPLATGESQSRKQDTVEAPLRPYC